MLHAYETNLIDRYVADKDSNPIIAEGIEDLDDDDLNPETYMVFNKLVQNTEDKEKGRAGGVYEWADLS